MDAESVTPPLHPSSLPNPRPKAPTTRADKLALVIELACITEDRSDQEHRALLDTARRCDDERNRARRRAFDLAQGIGSHLLTMPDPSNLEALVDETRQLEDGQKPVSLKVRRRRPWVDPS